MIRFFRHYIPVSMLLLTLVEFLFFYYVSEFASERYGNAQLLGAISDAAYKPFMFAAILTLLNSTFGLYDWEWTKGVVSLLTRVVGSVFIAAGVLALGGQFLPQVFPVGAEYLVGIIVAGLASILIRLLFMEWDKTDLFKKRILVLGTGTRAAKIEELTASGEAQGLCIVGFMPLGAVHHYVSRERILEETERSLFETATHLGVSEIVVAVRERRGGGLPMTDLLECKLRGLHILDLPAFFERQTGILPLEAINASWMIFAEGFTQGSSRDVVKRLFDLVVSGSFLLMGMPIMLLTAALIRLESKGPVFYTQERIGQFGHPFTIFKFRSMFTDAEKDGLPVWARQKDDRTTRVGRFIRRTRIDELPQVLNVFFGHMSFVGPRPERPYFVNELAAQIPYYHARHSVKPGITGWAQVKFPYGASVEDAMNKLQYDLYYVKNHSLFLDLMVLLQTTQVVVLGKGVR
ncbi:MAG: exopolysaccharide biosynthesis polyprenyl glycosylphosphotransferase [Hydrogenophilales bacterium 28-61-23]|nr:MAG: exopolysaccharide biosynthesis polyprenyl glycosylphosphotransferase [Hydrogenophilales bacterium 28-61-23]